MISIYKNESFLIEDKVKDYFKKTYKHLDFSIMYEETNDLITGYYITLIESRLMLRRCIFVSTEDMESYRDIYYKIIDALADLIRDMLYKYYYTA